MSSLDLAWIRNQFPALAQQINQEPILFFDGPGGTQVPIAVINAIPGRFRLWRVRGISHLFQY